MEHGLYTQDTSIMTDSNDYNGTTTAHYQQIFLDNGCSNNLFNMDTTPTTTTSAYEDDLDTRSPSMHATAAMPSSSLMLTPVWNQHQPGSSYFDASNNYNTNISTITGTGTGSVRVQNGARSERGIAGFVSKLYQCLQSNDTNQKYARWCKHDGKDMFIIDNIPEFTEFVLPRLFKHCKFPSFVRQLNIYGFQRDTDARKSKDTKDKESCRWFHPCFRPGRRDLFHLIRRKATRYSRKKRVKAITSSNEEDPETILNMGSGDESETEDDINSNGNPNQLLSTGSLLQDNSFIMDGTTGHEDIRRSSSSASSVNFSAHAMDFTNNETTTTTNNTSTNINSDATAAVTTAAAMVSLPNSTTAANTTTLLHQHPLSLNYTADPLTNASNLMHTNQVPINGFLANYNSLTPTNQNQVHGLINEDQLLSDNADATPTNNAHANVHSNQSLLMDLHQQQLQPLDQQQQHPQPYHPQDLRMQLFHMKRQYDRMHGFFEEQLNTAQLQIDKQQMRIQQLESALGMTASKSSMAVRPSPVGYIDTNTMVTDGTTATRGGGHSFHNQQPSSSIAAGTAANQQHLYHPPMQHVKNALPSSSSSNNNNNNNNPTVTNAFYFSPSNNTTTTNPSEQDQPIVSSQQALNEQKWVTPNQNYLSAKFSTNAPSSATTSPSSSTSPYNSNNNNNNNNSSNNHESLLPSFTNGMVATSNGNTTAAAVTSTTTTDNIKLEQDNTIHFHNFM